jgi:hypothetical protein
MEDGPEDTTDFRNLIGRRLHLRKATPGSISGQGSVAFHNR